jgi:hypothetical protein
MPWNDKEEAKIKEIIAKAWKDPAFKQRLLKDPKAAVKELGVELPNDLTLRVIERKTDEIILTLPPSPSDAKEITDKDLDKIAAAGCDLKGLSVCNDSCGMTKIW